MSSNTKIILVGGSKGGPGKSTIAQQIAGYLLVKAKKPYTYSISMLKKPLINGVRIEHHLRQTLN
ncbi:hypothetical protein AB6G19_23315 [Providencia manganoxydans]